MPLVDKKKLGFIVFLSYLSTTAVAQTSDENAPQDVEIGAGGSIRPEKPYRTELEEQFRWHAHLLWESRYVTEGRDNLSGHGIYSLSTEINYNNLSFIPWVADGIGTDFYELNLNFIYGVKLLDNLDVFFMYTNIQSRLAGIRFSDDEVGLDLVYFYNNLFYVTANIYYSFEFDGAFTELAVKKAYFIDNDLSLNLKAAVGFNSGYIPFGHNGINHGQFGAELSYQFIEAMEAYAYAGYNQAINRDTNRYPDDESLQDFFWGGIGLSYRF
jgi:hypothetical protein